MLQMAVERHLTANARTLGSVAEGLFSCENNWKTVVFRLKSELVEDIFWKSEFRD